MSDSNNSPLISKTYGGAWTLQYDHVEHWAYLEECFLPEECKKIIEMGNSLNPLPAMVFPKTQEMQYSLSPEDKQEKIFDIRKSKTTWFFPNEDTNWIFQRMNNIVNRINFTYFKFDLFALCEGIQFTRYDAPDGYYKCHVDKNVGANIRKLSLSIQLNESSEFDGGDLCLYFREDPDKPPMKQGTTLAFPSYVLHEVSPVTRGTRYSLVAWISGPPFK